MDEQSTPGQVSFKRTDMIAVGGQARQSAVIDIDRDGKADWMHEGGKSGTATWDQGDGKGRIGSHEEELDHYRLERRARASSPWTSTATARSTSFSGKRGYDEDKTGRCRIYLNDGKMNFTDATKECGLDDAGLQIMGVGDFRHTGALDLICLENGRDTTVYLNDGKGHFTKLPGAVTGLEKANRPAEANWGMAVMTDLDNDGIPDVMMNGRNFLYVLKGTGGGHFTYMNKTWGIDDHSDCAVDAGICFGDIDGDGMLDVLGFKQG